MQQQTRKKLWRLTEKRMHVILSTMPIFCALNLYMPTLIFSSPLLHNGIVVFLKLQLEFIYSEKATKFCEIFLLLLTVCTLVKSKEKILQNFVAFSEYMNFNSNLRKALTSLLPKKSYIFRNLSKSFEIIKESYYMFS